MILKEINIYPIKSCQGISLSSAEITAKGLKGDRELMLVDSQGKFLTQRQYPQLAQIKVAQQGLEFWLSREGQPENYFQFTPQPEGKAIPVEVWGDSTTAIDQGDEIAQWFQANLGISKPLRLVSQSSDYPRLLKPNYLVQSRDQVSFADAYPLLLTNTASLQDLNLRLKQFPDSPEEVPMDRFRPNLVIESNQPFVEDSWEQVKLGTIPLAVVKPCSRCIVITTNQQTGERNTLKEPLRTLSTFRQFSDLGVIFGQNLVPRDQGLIQVGDYLEVLTQRG